MEDLDYDLLSTAFDAHADLIEKARKAKGLDNWQKLAHLADQLQGKQAKHITFTSSHPAYEGRPVKHTLGSTTGNLQFLLGYGNPAFYLAPYHWKLIDPNLSDEEIAKLQHPSKPEYWEKSGLQMTDEGDFEEGQPHPSVKNRKDSEARRAARKEEALPAQSGYGYYVCIPSEGIVFCATTGQVLQWSIVRDSYFSATNPDIAEKMNEASYSPTLEAEEPEVPVEKSVSTRGGLSESEAKQLASHLKLDFDKVDFSFSEFLDGINHEIEHSDVVKRDPVKISKIALDHLKEDPKYYTKLEKVEKSIPSVLVSYLRPGSYDHNVYSLVKSKFPAPGTLIPMTAGLYGITTSSSIDFYTEDGNPAGIRVFDRVYKSFDLSVDGDVHPSILVNFGVRYLGMSKSVLSEYLTESVVEKSMPQVVQGEPTPGFESVPSEYSEYERAVSIVGNTFRVVPRI